MGTNLHFAPSELNRHGFIPSTVYVHESDRFHTRLYVYNYYSELFPATRTGTWVCLWFFDQAGELVAYRDTLIGYRRHFQFDVFGLGLQFEGIAAVSMIPETLPKLRHNLPVATGYHVMYFDNHANYDFMHEWSPVEFRPSRSGPFVTAVDLSQFPETDIVMMSAYFGDALKDGAGEWTLRFRDSQARILSKCATGAAPARGVARVRVREALPSLVVKPPSDGWIGVEINGQNIQRPLTWARSRAGDFSIHHF